MRIQKSDIPDVKTRCYKLSCVYNGHQCEHGWCSEPRTNNGNSDAKCFHMTNKALLRTISELKLCEFCDNEASHFNKKFAADYGPATGPFDLCESCLSFHIEANGLPLGDG